MNFAKSKKCQILFLQETHLSQQEAKLLRDWVGQISFSTYNTKSRGVVTLFHKNLNFIISRNIADAYGRYVITIGTLNNNQMAFVNVYVPPNSDGTVFHEINDHISMLGDIPIVMGGDFNTILYKIVDKSLPAASRGRNNAEIALNTLIRPSIRSPR